MFRQIVDHEGNAGEPLQAGFTLLEIHTKGSLQIRDTAISVVRMPRAKFLLELIVMRHTKNGTRGDSRSNRHADCPLHDV